MHGESVGRGSTEESLMCCENVGTHIVTIVFTR